MNRSSLAFKRLLSACLIIVFISCGGGDGNGDGSDGNSNGNNDDAIYDVESNGIPRFIDTNYIESSGIQKISRFRSGIGHDYSDDFESCRSMKHYFMPAALIDWSTIKVYTPISGTISDVRDEWAGTQLRIKAENQPAFHIIIFHINLNQQLSVGDMVTEGQEIGSHIGPQTMSDIAIGVQTPNGWKLISYFDVITDKVFQGYLDRGVNSRDELKISDQERDMLPLSCPDGEHQDFQDSGIMENWVQLN